MRRLTPSQPVVLDLEEEAIDCIVAAVQGDEEATLTPVEAADAAYIPSLGRVAALVFAEGGSSETRRVVGAVHRAADPGRLRFVPGAGTGLPARRQTARAGVELTVALGGPGAGGEPRRLLTSDVSLGGLGVRLTDWTPEPDAILDVALEVPEAEPIRGSARVLRVAGGVAGLAFSEITAGERGRLAAFLIASRATHRL
jgi:PilZ domain